MHKSLSGLANWKWSALAIAGIVILSLMPQIRFWLVRGSQWQGSYATLQGDEFLYAGYLNALINNRHRRSDPMAGQNDHPQAPLHESLYSIQIIPPFIIAFLARTSGASASAAFIILLGAAGLLAALALFWLFTSVTGDNQFAGVAVLAVLCFGALAGGQGLVGLFLNPSDTKFLGLPFLRRYLPSAAFPLFFVFCTLIWQALTTGNRKLAKTLATVAGAVISSLVFSYFYLWTAAAAWFVCVIILWIVFKPIQRRQTLGVLIIVVTCMILPLILYAYLISQLPPAFDRSTVILNFTHLPDLLRIPEFIGAFLLVALILVMRRNKSLRSRPQTILTLSFALLPFLVFNQQIITGRSVQPFHYEIFIANYAVLVGLLLFAHLLRPTMPRRLLVQVAILCFVWGMIEVNVPFKARVASEIRSDEMVPVLLRLRDLARHDGTWESLRGTGKTSTLVFSPHIELIKILPTWAPQGSMLAPGTSTFQSSTRDERKHALHFHLYYAAKDMNYLRALLTDQIKDTALTYHAKTTLFGPERILSFISKDYQPITAEEIEIEVSAYGIFVDSVSKEVILERPISYVVAAEQFNDFSRIDLWYERDGGEKVGAYHLYRLSLRR